MPVELPHALRPENAPFSGIAGVDCNRMILNYRARALPTLGGGASRHKEPR